ncbi:hypothetical protein N7535_000811 [Penicillium sp. DV-2018c]|nr:hypothetical protein N7535_000811 [Penicillium sp. DV-2018c]
MLTIPLTPSTVSSRTVVSADQFKMLDLFKEAIHTTILGLQGFHELVITDLPPGWEDFLGAEEEYLPTTRKSYDPASRKLRLKIMPTNIHNCLTAWFSTSFFFAGTSGFLNDEEGDILCLDVGTSNGPYRGLRKEPDLLVFTPSRPFPSLVAEVGWSESYEDLLHDMNKLLVGSDGGIKIVLLVKWTKHSHDSVSGVLELYRNEREGIPRLRQTEVIFPEPIGDPLQPLDIQRRDLYPTGPPRNPKENFPLLVSRLRRHARRSLARQGYVPA